MTISYNYWAFGGFKISERIKQNAYYDTFAKVYFWRTKQQQKVDFVEEKSGQITGYEFKWNARNSKLPELTVFFQLYMTKRHNSFPCFQIVSSFIIVDNMQLT